MTKTYAYIMHAENNFVLVVTERVNIAGELVTIKGKIIEDSGPLGKLANSDVVTLKTSLNNCIIMEME